MYMSRNFCSKLFLISDVKTPFFSVFFYKWIDIFGVFGFKLFHYMLQKYKLFNYKPRLKLYLIFENANKE